MAKLVQAFSAFGPKIDLREATLPRRFLELITLRTTLSSGVVKNVQESEVETRRSGFVIQRRLCKP